MFIRLLAVLIGSLTFFAASTISFAQDVEITPTLEEVTTEEGCGAHSDIVVALEGEGQTIEMRARTDRDNIVEVFKNPLDGRWTYVLSDRGGNACVATKGYGMINRSGI